jgi:hypothetical protein
MSDVEILARAVYAQSTKSTSDWCQYITTVEAARSVQPTLSPPSE